MKIPKFSLLVALFTLISSSVFATWSDGFGPERGIYTNDDTVPHLITYNLSMTFYAYSPYANGYAYQSTWWGYYSRDFLVEPGQSIDFIAMGAQEVAWYFGGYAPDRFSLAYDESYLVSDVAL